MQVAGAVSFSFALALTYAAGLNRLVSVNIADGVARRELIEDKD